MEYNRIISVTGLGGLFELVGSKADGAIVRSLEDKSTRFVSSRSHHFSHLESIEVYTIRENVNLLDVFKAMKAANETLPDYKDLSAVKTYFSKAYPELDFERVYASDMKKMVRWYNILISNDIDFEISAETPENDASAATPEISDDGPVKEKAEKKAPKKAAEKAQEAEKPKKSPAAKKKKKEEEK